MDMVASLGMMKDLSGGVWGHMGVMCIPDTSGLDGDPPAEAE